MHATQHTMASLIFATVCLLSGVKLAADEPKSNPFRDGTGQGDPDTEPTRKALSSQERAKFDAQMREFDEHLTTERLKLVAAILESQLRHLQLDLKDLKSGPQKAPSAAIRHEAALRAEEVLQKMRRDAVAKRLQELIFEETKARLEIHRLKALPKKPEDGSIKRALEALDEVMAPIETAKADLIRIEQEYGERVAELKRQFEMARPHRDAEDKVAHEIDTTRALLSSLNVRLLALKFGVAEPVKAENEKILKELSELRREVKGLREQK